MRVYPGGQRVRAGRRVPRGTEDSPGTPSWETAPKACAFLFYYCYYCCITVITSAAAAVAAAVAAAAAAAAAAVGLSGSVAGGRKDGESGLLAVRNAEWCEEGERLTPES